VTGTGRTSSLPPRFVGRERELELLLDTWREAIARERRAVFVAGEPGIGKTRVVWELVRRLDGDDTRALLGHCSPDLLVPYQPIVEALEGLRGLCPPDELARHLRDVPSGELARLVPRLVEDLPGRGAALPSDPRAERHRLFTAVATLLLRAARATPMVLVLEDLHWADQPTLRMLRYVLRAPAEEERSGARGGLLVVGTYRDTELEGDDPLSELLADLHRDDLAARLTLTGMSQAEVARLARAVSGEAIADERARELYRATGGNPLFVRELAGQHEVGAVPERISDAIAGRLERLDPDARTLVTVAAAIGPQFELELVERVTGLQGMGAVDAVDQASAAGLIEELHPSVGAFAHAVVRSAVYESIDEQKRPQLHLRIAEALERQPGRRDGERVAELAHHFLAASDERGATYAVRAGHEAFERLAYEAAAEHWERAIRVLGPPSARDGLEVLLALADARWRSGEFERAQERYIEAAELAHKLELPDLLATAALGLGGRMGFGAGRRDEQLIALLEQALEALPDGDDPLRARLLARLAEALAFSERERLSDLCEQAVAMARRIGDPSVLAAVLLNVRFAVWGPSNAQRRCETADEVVRLAQDASDVALEVDGRLSRVVDLLELGEVERADAELELCGDKAQEVRQRYQLWWLACLLALRALMDGRIADADELATHALQIGQRDRNQNALQIYGGQLAGMRREQGRFAELEDGVKAFIAQYPAIPTWRCTLAFLYANAGRVQEAQQELDALGTDSFAGLPRDMFWLADLAQAGQAAAYAGAVEHARVLYELLAPHARQNVVVAIAACWGSTSRVLGLLARTLGRTGEAARHFEDAIEQNAAIGAVAWRARTEVEYAELLLDEAGERERAETLLEGALTTANEFSLVDIAARARAALRHD
jgi:tetratricopeptide (TPR) repeat protein